MIGADKNRTTGMGLVHASVTKSETGAGLNDAGLLKDGKVCFKSNPSQGNNYLQLPKQR